MATSNPIKRIWTQHCKLQLLATSTDLALPKFTIESSSFDNATTTPPSQPSNAAAASTIQVEYVSIIGLIYPSTEPFRQHAVRVELRVPHTYPFQPPDVYMKMSIRHPNIEKDGKFCTALLHQTEKWAAISLVDVIKIATDLIDHPERDHVVDGEMGSLYDMNTIEYNRQLKEMVTRHGVPRT